MAETYNSVQRELLPCELSEFERFSAMDQKREPAVGPGPVELSPLLPSEPENALYDAFAMI